MIVSSCGALIASLQAAKGGGESSDLVFSVGLFSAPYSNMRVNALPLHTYSLSHSRLASVKRILFSFVTFFPLFSVFSS